MHSVLTWSITSIMIMLQLSRRDSFSQSFEPYGAITKVTDLDVLVPESPSFFRYDSILPA